MAGEVFVCPYHKKKFFLEEGMSKPQTLLTHETHYLGMFPVDSNRTGSLFLPVSQRWVLRTLEEVSFLPSGI